MAPQHSSTSLVSVDEENIDNVSIIRSAKGMEKNSKSLMAKANEMVVQLMGMSNMTSDDNEVTIPRFRTEEIKTGRVLGRGGFCIVKQLHEIRLRVLDDDRLSVRCGSTNRWSIRDGKGGTCSDDDDASSTGFGGAARSTISRWNRRRRNKYISTGSLASASIEQGERGKYPRRVSGSSSICSSSIIGGGSCRFDAFSTALDLNSREYIARRSRVQKGERYVVKIVDPKLKETDKTHYLKGIVDLSMEAQFLSSLDHPNIISLRGLCAAFPYQNVIQMIILDNLPEIFNQRLNTWMQAYRTTRGITGFVTRGRRRAKDLLTDRLIVGYDIARAMEYIHSKNIVYRDLKPDNIGFDADGVMKLFDFGLAKDMTNARDAGKGLYHLTGLTGALRYMAPEVGLGLPYNQKADVYSWSMLFWYILALEPPLGTFTNSMFVDRVFTRGCRPAVNGKWSKSIRRILKHSWQSDISKRLDFQTVLKTLRKEIQLGEFAYNVDDDKVAGSVRTGGTACESTINEWEASSGRTPTVIPEQQEVPDYYPTQYKSTKMLEI